MDPLSLTASVIAVVQLCAATSKLFVNLKEACRALPGRLSALESEVADLAAVLDDVANVIHERQLRSIPLDDQAQLKGLLTYAVGKLDELQTLVLELTTIAKNTRIALLEANAWRKVQGRLKALQDELQGVKTSINVLLGASNSRDIAAVREQLEIAATTSRTYAQQQINFHHDLRSDIQLQRADFKDSVALMEETVNRRMATLEQTILDQQDRMYKNRLTQLHPPVDGSVIRQRRASREANEKHLARYGNRRHDKVGMPMVQYFARCPTSCPCCCHTQRRASTPAMVDRWLGRLSVQYTGMPAMTKACNHPTCQTSQPAQVNVEYWFPLGFLWSQIVRLRMGYEPNIGPQLQLALLRRVPDSAAAVDYAVKGNVDGLKDLFRRGVASPRDVSSTRGYTLLRWAMYAKQWQTCRFLMHAGADPDYRPISPGDNSPRNKANDFLMIGNLSGEAEELYRLVAAGVDYIDEQNFCELHHVILGLSSRSIEEVLDEHPEQLEALDAKGRTPLSWAACKGDRRAIIVLLAHGADPNTVDIQNSGPVTNAADQGHTACVRLLLEAGGECDPIRPEKKGSPLNCAARNAHDPLLIQTLLDFGANIEACGVDGITPLIHATRRDYHAFAQICLDYGADINAMSTAQHTPLTTAIAHNSHKVLQLLLDKWDQYSECPRLKGPHMLPLVAQFADLETIQILAATDHFKLKYDPKYKVDNYLKTLQARYDADEKLQQAFVDFLALLDFQVQPESTLDGKLESGVLSRRNSTKLETVHAVSGADPEDDLLDMDQFEDALENLAHCHVASRVAADIV